MAHSYKNLNVCTEGRRSDRARGGWSEFDRFKIFALLFNKCRHLTDWSTIAGGHLLPNLLLQLTTLLQCRDSRNMIKNCDKVRVRLSISQLGRMSRRCDCEKENEQQWRNSKHTRSTGDSASQIEIASKRIARSSSDGKNDLKASTSWWQALVRMVTIFMCSSQAVIWVHII